MAASSSWRRRASLGSRVPRGDAADVAGNVFSGVFGFWFRHLAAAV